MPDGLLMPEAEEIWFDLVGDAASLGATRLDSWPLALLCNLLAAIRMGYRDGQVPPRGVLAEARALMSALGLLGLQSRILRGGGKRQPAEPSVFDKYCT
jgi:hypothetical protein